MDKKALPDIFYSRSYTLHRLSPLHFTSSYTLLSETQLQAHARRFHNSIKGNILRGIITEPSSKAEATKWGMLKDSRWSLLKRNQGQPFRADTEDQSSDVEIGSITDLWGIQIEVEYEKMVHVAFMLRNDRVHHLNDERELHLPLLLTHMPTFIRDLLIQYLTTAFDIRAEVMRLSSDSLGQLLDCFIDTASKCGPDGLVKLVKDVHISVGFRPPIAPSLRNLDVAIRKNDVPGFLNHGIKSIKIKECDVNGREAKRWKSSRLKTVGPFMTAFDEYMRTHLAMNLGHEGIHISKISCGGIMLSKEGKARIQPPSASIDMVGQESNESAIEQNATIQLVRQLVLASQVETFDQFG